MHYVCRYIRIHTFVYTYRLKNIYVYTVVSLLAMTTSKRIDFFLFIFIV